MEIPISEALTQPSKPLAQHPSLGWPEEQALPSLQRRELTEASEKASEKRRGMCELGFGEQVKTFLQERLEEVPVQWG